MMKFVFVVALIVFPQFAVNIAFEIEPQIVNGYSAEAGQFPYYAFLYTTDQRGDNMGCGGVLISDEWIITAASCIINTESLLVHLGTSELDEFSSPEYTAIKVHKDHFYPYISHFEPISWNDIALIRLPFKVTFSTYIQPVRMPSTCKVPENTKAITMGNGAIEDISSQLHFDFLQTLPLKTCRKQLPLLLWRKSIICALNDMDNQSVCSGDSGGPLVTCSDQTLIGISLSILPGSRGPQTFTNVYTYLSWIKKITDLDLPNC